MHTNRHQNQSGGVLILMAVCCLLLLGVLAYAMDLPRGQVELTELQNAIDAAALAGARQLNGSGQGVERAQEAIYAVLAHNRVGGVPIDSSQVKIRFGFYGAPDNSNYSFEAMIPGEKYGGVAVESLINAVQLLGVNQTPTVFGRVWGIGNLGEAERQAIAVANNELEQCVLPLAIPACQLLLSQDPNEEGFYTEQVDYQRQCAREVVITEASFWEPLAYARRGIGFMRYQWLNRLPAVQFDKASKECGVSKAGMYPNCRAELIQGTMVVAPDQLKEVMSDSGDYQQSMAISPDQFLKVLKNMLRDQDSADDRGGLRCSLVKLGTFLHPLENGVDSGDGMLLARDKGRKLESILYDLIQGDAENPTFSSVFGDARAGTAADNYPFLRSKFEDRVISWPNFQSDRQILMDDMGSWQYTNPLCHYRGHDEDGNVKEIPINSPDQGRVREVVIMLVAPGLEHTDYCDFDFQYNKSSAVQAAPPSAYYKPRVVGFASAYLFDFNFSNLSEQFSDETPRYGYQAGGNVNVELIDNNPLGIVSTN